ncbi:MAG: OmpH family outer membrane protein [Opitutaceae bacterium]|jgi:outer membrane protein
MKKPINSLLTLGAFGVATVIAQAQPAPKIVVVDMAKIFENHYETVAETAKLKDATDKAQAQVDQMNKEGDALVAEYKELNDQSQSALATPDAKAKATEDAKKKAAEINQKVADRNKFVTDTRAVLQDRNQKFRASMLEEISKVVVTVAKRHDATLVIDKSGPTLLGIASVVYADPSYDITQEVMDEINKNRPAGTPAPMAAPSMTAPAMPAPASSSDVPKITVPGVTAPAK